MAVNLKPLGDRVLVEPVEEKELKKGGIIIPDTAKEKPTEGVIVALGTGKTDDNGKKVPFEVKKGDRVLISKYGGTEIKLNGKEYKILNSDDILAMEVILTKKKEAYSSSPRHGFGPTNSQPYPSHFLHFFPIHFCRRLFLRQVCKRAALGFFAIKNAH